MYTCIHLNVSRESYLFQLFDLSLDLKSVLWQMLNCLYSETYMIYLWVSFWAYISGKSLMHMLQLIHVNFYKHHLAGYPL